MSDKNKSFKLHLLEVSRKNLVGKTKVGSPQRYNKRLYYAAMSVPDVDEEQLIENDLLVLQVRVGKYVDIVAFEGVIEHFIEVVRRDPAHAVTRRNLVKALNEQIDKTDVYVRCSCPDFRYRFAYYATKFDYIYGKPENRPANITNPHDKLGAVCKHLTSILSNKKWLVKASSVINRMITDHYDDILRIYDVNPDEFIMHAQQRRAAATGASRRKDKALPPNLAFISNRKFNPRTLEFDLNELLLTYGWNIRVDTDLNKPTQVFISKDIKALEDPFDTTSDVYVFDVVPIGTRVRLNRAKLDT